MDIHPELPPIRPRRSALYTPGSNPAVMGKALASRADVLIFDLEDAVSPVRKAVARDQVCEVLASHADSLQRIVVRVNGLDTAWVGDDVAAVGRFALAGVLFPKIGSPAHIEHAAALMAGAGAHADTELWCMIETPLAILNLHALARVCEHPGRYPHTWVVGGNDLLKELHARDTADRWPLLPALAQVLLAARAYGIEVLDGVYNDFKNSAGFEASCVQGRSLGFDGKTLIHPAQIETCNRLFSPSALEIDQARAIVAAFDQPEHRGSGVLQVNGSMVELLHATAARRTLAQAEFLARIDAQPASNELRSCK